MSSKANVRIRIIGDSSGLRPALIASENMLGGFANKAKVALVAGGAAAAYGFAKAFGEAMNREQLAGKFGDDIVARAATVYKNAWGESLEDVATQMTETQRAFGDVANLEQLTEAAFILSQKFDRDVSSSIQDASELAESFGIDGAKAFDLLAVAMEGNTAEVNDELSASIREYGDFFEGLGFSAERTLQVLTNFGEGGAMQMDKAADALKELTIRGTDMSAASGAAFEAMGKDQQLYAELLLEGGDAASDAMFGIIRGLQGIKDPAEQANAAIALFGAPLEDLGTGKIPEFLASFQGMQHSFADAEGSITSLGNEMSDNLGTKLEGIKRQGLEAITVFMEERLIPVATQVVDAFIEHWPKIQATIADVTTRVGEIVAEYWPTVKAFIVDATTAIAEAVEKYWPVVRETIRQVVEWFFDDAWPVIEKVYGYIVDGLEYVVELAQEHWPQIREIIETAVEAIRAFIDRTIIIVTDLWEQFGDDILAFAEKAWGYISDIVAAALDFIQSTFATFRALFTGDWDAMWEGIKGIVTAVKDGIIAAVGLIWEGIKLAVPIAWEGIKAAVTTGFNTVKQAIIDFGPGLLEAAKRLWNNIKTGAAAKFFEIRQYIIDKLKELPGVIVGFAVDLYNAGKDLFTQLKNGLIDALIGIPGAIADKVLGPLDEIASKAGGLLDLVGAVTNPVGAASGFLTGSSSGSSSEPEFVPFGEPSAIADFAAGGGNAALYLHSGSNGPITPDMAQGLPGLKRNEVLAVLEVGEEVIAKDETSGGPFIGQVVVTDGRSVFDELDLAYKLHGMIAS